MDEIDKLWKYCKRCDSWKTKLSFGKHTASNDGLKSSCKTCISKYNKGYKIANMGKYYGVVR